MLVLKVFKSKQLDNPYNYNRAFEWLQAKKLGFKLSNVGGGSDGYIGDTTAEFKATAYKGLTQKGKEKSHTFQYNGMERIHHHKDKGTSRKDTLKKQEEICRKKIMRDPYHYWSLIDYKVGKFVRTYKVPAETVWRLLWPKLERSWYKSKAKDPRIGCSVSTNELRQSGWSFKFKDHQSRNQEWREF